ncbi:arylamine N-acetyltransferase family protein [[Erwinia] mediterraneensis]|uniref:arylamine N-acetyltransferase family protein n=1 Tax=[Erwinia] mediterraneensis TaxID=2161819 RepID=UPI00103277B5|nr:arylamine N-acetyltransferase [[Erwinia] mediterraneensis]
MTFSLPAYFARIGYQGAPQPDLATLRQLHLHHSCAIPFENLDVLLERPIVLDDDAVFTKLVSAGRGGYCYEQNALFSRALETIGFEVQPLAARVMLMQPETMPPRTHRLLCVTLEKERWIADVGFGGLTLTAPVRLDSDAEQLTPHGAVKIVKTGSDYLLMRQKEQQWLTLYRFDLTMQYAADYLMANHFVSTWPDSHFRHHLQLARQLPDGRINTLFDTTCTRHGGATQHQTLSADALYALLPSGFRLRLDDPQHGITRTDFRQLIARLASAKQSLP